MNFVQIAEQLKTEMVTEHVAVNPQKNPVSLHFSALTTPQLKHILVQYTVFSRKVVSFLVDALYVAWFEGWQDLAQELRQNIREEFSEDTDVSSRAPHYILLRRGFLNALGTDLAMFVVQNATQAFVAAMHHLLVHQNAAFVAGGVYAMESTARPELQMTYQWTQELFRRHAQTMPADVRTFFTSHIDDIEILHESRLRDVCATYMKTAAQKESFTQGFRAVVQAMDMWWHSLHTEAHTLHPNN